MPDLLAHALLAYAIARILSWRYEWLTAQYVTVCMVGAFIPDLAKAELVVPNTVVEELFTVPFEWFGLHTGGAVLVSVLVGVLVVIPRERSRAFLLLALGAGTHLLADGLLRTPSGRSYAMFWPLTRYNPPTPGLYLSTEPGPTLVAACVAVVVWLITSRRPDGRS